MGPVIREISSDEEIESSAMVIRESFGTVARQFGLTRANCPTHPSFVTAEALRGISTRGQRFFGLFDGGLLTGFVAVEKVNDGEYTMEKLAVAPAARHRGHGERLVHFVFDLATAGAAARLTIAIIDEHTILKDWYNRLGFVETGTRRFGHLPFTVCFMEAALAGTNREVSDV